MKKNSPSVNNLFQRKQIIEDFEAELTGSLTKIGWYIESTCGLAHHVSQGQRPHISSVRFPDKEQINKRSAAWQLKILIVLT